MNFNIQFNGESLEWTIPYLVVYLLVWLFTLGAALVRWDMDVVTKLMWVIVILFVPLFGMVLYVALAPRPRKIDPSNSLSGTPWENDPGYTSRNRG
jgi:uncharacterized membrane protein YgcG